MNITDHTCPICGKNFIPAPMHLYREQKNDGKLFCSYTCWMKFLNKKQK